MEGGYLGMSSCPCSDFNPSHTAKTRTVDTQNPRATEVAPADQSSSISKPYLHPAGRAVMRVLLLFQRLDEMSILDRISGKESETRREAEANEKRPIKFVEEKPNIWRIVYAD